MTGGNSSVPLRYSITNVYTHVYSIVSEQDYTMSKFLTLEYIRITDEGIETMLLAQCIILLSVSIRMFKL